MNWFFDLISKLTFASMPKPEKPKKAERTVKYRVEEETVEVDVQRIKIVIKLKGKTLTIIKVGEAYEPHTAYVSLVTGMPKSTHSYMSGDEDRDDVAGYVSMGIPGACLPNVYDITGDPNWITYQDKKRNTVRIPREQIQSVTISEPYEVGDVKRIKMLALKVI